MFKKFRISSNYYLTFPMGGSKRDSVDRLCRLTTKREVVGELLFSPAEVFSHKELFKEKIVNILKLPESTSHRIHNREVSIYIVERASKSQAPNPVNGNWYI